jgi:hypothetical protein
MFGGFPGNAGWAGQGKRISHRCASIHLDKTPEGTNFCFPNSFISNKLQRDFMICGNSSSFLS